MENEVIETRTARIWLDADAIVHVVEKPNLEVTLGDTKDYLTAILNVSKGKRRPVLADINMTKSITREARHYIRGSEMAGAVSAIGLYASSPVSRVLGSFFLKLDKPSYPVKMFCAKEDAQKWLNSYADRE